MRNYLTIGSAPCDEECAQMGDPGYQGLAYEECDRFRELIRRNIGMEPEGATLTIKSFPHDFGNYLELVCVYDDDYPESEDYAFRCEAEAPATWDEKPSNNREDEMGTAYACGYQD